MLVLVGLSYLYSLACPPREIEREREGGGGGGEREREREIEIEEIHKPRDYTLSVKLSFSGAFFGPFCC